MLPLSAIARTSLHLDGSATTWTRRIRRSWRALSSTAARALTSIAQTWTISTSCAFVKWLRMELAGSGRRSRFLRRQRRQHCPPLQGCRLCHLLDPRHRSGPRHLSALRPCHPLSAHRHRRPPPRASTTIHSIHAPSSGDLIRFAPIQCVRRFAAPLVDAAP